MSHSKEGKQASKAFIETIGDCQTELSQAGKQARSFYKVEKYIFAKKHSSLSFKNLVDDHLLPFPFNHSNKEIPHARMKSMIQTMYCVKL